MLNEILRGNFISALMFLIAAVLSIMLHELAHGYAAIKSGDLTPKYRGRMTLNPVKHFDPIGFLLFFAVGFGWAKPVPVNPSNFRNYRKGLFWVSIAGVLVNFTIAFFAYPVAQLIFVAINNASNGMTFISLQFLYYFFEYLFLLNLSLCVFNLLPIYPLDGFRIIESRAKYNNKYVEFMYKYGSFAFIGFILLINFTNFNLLGILRNYIAKPIYIFWGLFGF